MIGAFDPETEKTTQAWKRSDTTNLNVLVGSKNLPSQPGKTKTNIPVPTKRDLEVSSGESDCEEVKTSEADTSAPSSVKSSAKKAKKVKEDPLMRHHHEPVRE